MEEETNSIFKFWYEKLTMRFSFALAFFSFLGVFVYAYYTEIAAKLPGKEVPFIENIGKPTNDGGLSQEYKILPEEDTYVSIDEPHRTNKELQGWISTVVSESLFFDADDYEEIQKRIDRYYSEAGMKQYQRFLTETEIIKSLRNNNYRLSVFLEEQPLLLNAANMQGIYRWLYQAPITVTFLPRNVYNLQGASEDMVNRRLSLKVQIKRVELPDDPNAIQIESWTVSPRR